MKEKYITAILVMILLVVFVGGAASQASKNICPKQPTNQLPLNIEPERLNP